LGLGAIARWAADPRQLIDRDLARDVLLTGLLERTAAAPMGAVRAQPVGPRACRQSSGVVGVVDGDGAAALQRAKGASQPFGGTALKWDARAVECGLGVQDRPRQRAATGARFDDDERISTLESLPLGVDHTSNERAEQRPDLGTRQEVTAAAAGAAATGEEAVLAVEHRLQG